MAAVGIATGARSTLSLVPIAAASDRRVVTAGVAALVVGELTADKLPQAPSRTAAPSALGRVVLGAVGARSVARRRGVDGLAPVLVGAAGAVVGTLGGHAVRTRAGERGLGTRVALAEDAVALALVAWAVQQPPGPGVDGTAPPAST